MDGERIVVQVFEGTKGLSLDNTRTRLTGHPMELALSPEIIGRVFDGVGRPIDGLGEIFPIQRLISTVRRSIQFPVSIRKLYKHGYFYNRYPDDAYQRAEAPDFLWLRYEPQ